MSGVNFRDQELDFPMGDGSGGKYATIIKEVRLGKCSIWAISNADSLV